MRSPSLPHNCWLWEVIHRRKDPWKIKFDYKGEKRPVGRGEQGEEKGRDTVNRGTIAQEVAPGRMAKSDVWEEKHDGHVRREG